jgi:hypothetical protein
MRSLLIALAVELATGCWVSGTARAEGGPTEMPGIGILNGPQACQDFIRSELATTEGAPFGIDPTVRFPNSGKWRQDLFLTEVPILAGMLAAEVTIAHPDLSPNDACRQMTAGILPPIAIYE